MLDDENVGAPYEGMLNWPEKELMDELDLRIARLDRVVHDLEDAEQIIKPQVALLGIAIFGLLSVGSLLLVLLPYTRIHSRYPETFGYFLEITAVLIAPIFLYALYAAYSNYRAFAQRRQSVEHFTASAHRLLAEAGALSNRPAPESFGDVENVGT